MLRPVGWSATSGNTLRTPPDVAGFSWSTYLADNMAAAVPKGLLTGTPRTQTQRDDTQQEEVRHSCLSSRSGGP